MAYYKIKKDSALGVEIATLLTTAKLANDEAQVFADKVGGKAVSNSHYLGGAVAVHFSDKAVVRKEWKFYDKKNKFYTPKAQSSIKKGWDDRLVVMRRVFDKMVGNEDFRKQVGMTQTDELFLVDSYSLLSPHNDVYEIVSNEYLALATEESNNLA